MSAIDHDSVWIEKNISLPILDTLQTIKFFAG